MESTIVVENLDIILWSVGKILDTDLVKTKD